MIIIELNLDYFFGQVNCGAPISWLEPPYSLVRMDLAPILIAWPAPQSTAKRPDPRSSGIALRHVDESMQRGKAMV